MMSLLKQLATKIVFRRTLSTQCTLCKWVKWEPRRDYQVVRQDSILKSIVLLDKSYPVYIERLDEIGKSHNGWLNRMVPPPELDFNVRRDKHNRIIANVTRVKSRFFTTLENVEGNLNSLKDCLKWRLGKTVAINVDEKRGKVVTYGFYRREIITLLQGLGF